MKILITGSAGFIGRHLVEALRRRPASGVVEYDLGSTADELERGLREADVIYHLAGINRPQSDEEFKTGNTEFTHSLCSALTSLGRKPVFVLSSSIQAVSDNPYGRSKRAAELAVASWAEREGAHAVIFRLKNVFGKWCRPNYNSVTATFCSNIAHNLPITISDPARELDLVYIDDVVAAFLAILDPAQRVAQDAQGAPLPLYDLRPPTSDLRPPAFGWCVFREVPRSYKITLGHLAATIRSFRDSRQSLMLPSFEDEFTRRLYVTYLSYLDGPDFSYALQQRSDPRGTLAEFMKSESFGQIFVSRTKPGVTRGNHYHHSKTEKFLVLEGEAVVRFRSINDSEVIEHRVNGREFRVVDIPPGYTHSIENIGPGDLVTLFWASEVFDPQAPDTITLPVLP
jgi:UDP-2-acetamido-2,6-beta-L-arabino-hexul-4-ose reductase